MDWTNQVRTIEDVKAVVNLIRQAKGPITGIALLLIGLVVAVFFTVSQPPAPATKEAPEQTVPLGELSATTTLATAPQASTTNTTTTAPVTTTQPAKTTAPSTTPETTTTAPATTAATTAATTTTSPDSTTSTTTVVSVPAVNWRTVMPPMPAGGAAKLVTQNATRYAITITYPNMSGTDLAAALGTQFSAAGWNVTGSATALGVTKTGVSGSITVQGPTATIDLRAI